MLYDTIHMSVFIELSCHSFIFSVGRIVRYWHSIIFDFVLVLYFILYIIAWIQTDWNKEYIQVSRFFLFFYKLNFDVKWNSSFQILLFVTKCFSKLVSRRVWDRVNGACIGIDREREEVKQNSNVNCGQGSYVHLCFLYSTFWTPSVIIMDRT